LGNRGLNIEDKTVSFFWISTFGGAIGVSVREAFTKFKVKRKKDNIVKLNIFPIFIKIWLEIKSWSLV
jgi:hypothetical protein